MNRDELNEFIDNKIAINISFVFSKNEAAEAFKALPEALMEAFNEAKEEEFPESFYNYLADYPSHPHLLIPFYFPYSAANGNSAIILNDKLIQCLKRKYGLK
jgi:hypothetical protein